MRRSRARGGLVAWLLLPLLAACAGAPRGEAGAEGIAARLPPELFGLQRGATEAFTLPRLGNGLTVRYAPANGSAVASIFVAARGEPGIAGEDPRQPAAITEFERMLAEAEAFGVAAPDRRVRVRELFLVAFRGRPMVRCALLTEELQGEPLDGLRCLGVAQERFVRVFLTAAPGTFELRRAAGFAALATAMLQGGVRGEPSLPTREDAEPEPVVPLVPGPIYRT